MLRRFATNRSGNFAIMFGLAMVPIVGAVALAVDYTAASRQRSELHNAADAAALALARRGDELSQLEAEQLADEFIQAHFAGSYSDLTVVKTDDTWSVAVAASSATRFAKIFGVDASSVSVESAATFALNTYEIGLVLDTTGSMRGEKLEQLKSAATELVDTMAESAVDPDMVKMALVPFSSFVNVGPQFGPQFDADGKVTREAAPWLDMRGKNPIPQVELAHNLSRFQMFHHLGQEWEGCIETRPPHKDIAYDVTDAPATSKDRRSLFVPAFSIDEPDDRSRTGRPLYPNSYLEDDGTTLRDPKRKRLREKYHVELQGSGDPDLIGGLLDTVTDVLFEEPPAVDDSRAVFWSGENWSKGPNLDCQAQPILPLTSDYDLIKERIDGLVAEGATNMLEGVTWGWRVLSPGEPFAEGRAKSVANNEKIMIFLTDGANTWNQLSNSLGSMYSSFGYAVDERLVSAGSGAVMVSNAMDTKTLAGCTNAKADGITIYVIRLELQDKSTGTLLSQCATSEAHYFDVPDAATLDETFGKIADSIRRVRISS
ncbi:TadE/TadG family protein [Georhizobium profundi]|uniref:TadE/TadG family protein n=1 Tax=Georhizobium profundi TaxID=2341112 RepID=A0A3Q8XMS3_9HYPH|nr:pilus assembly protein [Georhizobium profundi]AZN71195.1 TadE/TadG family protein [Georhizobium profundi]